MNYGDYPSLTGVKRILVVKLRYLGDVLLTGPVFSALQHALPDAKIDAYIYQEAFPILEGHPAIHQLIGYDRNWKKLSFWQQIRNEVSLLKQIRRNKYDLVIGLTEGDRGALAAFVSGAKIRVGFPPKSKWQRKLLTHIAKECPTPRHTVEKNLDVIRRIGIFPRQEERELYFHVPEEAKKKIDVPPSFILIHPASRWRYKCWPIEKMRELIRILRSFGKQVVVSTGQDPVEVAMAAQICAGLDVLNLAGTLSIKELGALIDASDCLICVDSLPFHLANALKKRVVALFGPTSDIHWGIWRNPNAQIVSQKLSCRPCFMDGCGGSKRSDCLETLSVESVIQRVHSN
jgi:heptosyltransferase-3